jgi:hypothetical protein
LIQPSAICKRYFSRATANEIAAARLIPRAFAHSSSRAKTNGSIDTVINSDLPVGPPDRTRTCYPRLRRPVLYPDELRADALQRCNRVKRV